MSDFRITLIHEIYAPKCIKVAAEEYRRSLQVSVVRKDERETTLSISGEGGESVDERAVRDFLNGVLDLSVRAALEGI